MTEFLIELTRRKPLRFLYQQSENTVKQCLSFIARPVSKGVQPFSVRTGPLVTLS